MTDPSSAAPHNISVSTMTFVKAVLIVIGLWFLWYVRDILAMILAAILLAALIDPFADWFEARKVPRGLAVVIVYIVLGIIATGVIILLVPVVLEQFTQLFGSTPFAPALANVFADTPQTIAAFKEIALAILRGETTSVTALFEQVRGFVVGIAALFVVLVLTFYMVVEEDTAKKIFKNVAPVEYQPYLAQLLTKMQSKMGAWLRGQLILGVIIGVAVYVGLSLLGIKYALLLAVIAGLFEIVPYVGPTLALIPAAIIGFAQSLVSGLAVIAVYVVIQQLENNILVPKVMQKVTGLNPVVSIVALLVGIKVGGLVGALLSIPVATMGVVVLEDMFRTSDRS
jgi:predicted PurR-regulated permease PerM